VNQLVRGLRKLVQQLRKEMLFAPAQETGLGLSAASVEGTSSRVSSNCERDRVRFGRYEADLRTHELWKDGIKVRLVGQPFIILEVLLRRPGKLITREELRSRIWPSDTFVDFDHGLNAAVNKLREALGDSVANPQYVETLPRRGYRFVAKVESLPFTSEASFPAQGSQSNPPSAILPWKALASQEPNR
jgi:DNA-binding winged helix-turn-helix (wHTH) protein